MNTFYFDTWEDMKFDGIMHILRTFGVCHTWNSCPRWISVQTNNKFILRTINAAWERFYVDDEPIII